jgi:hypothetical protein
MERFVNWIYRKCGQMWRRGGGFVNRPYGYMAADLSLARREKGKFCKK